MYKKLKIELATDKIDFRKSSCFQGALFELMDTDYVSILHLQPTTRYVTWVVPVWRRTVAVTCILP